MTARYHEGGVAIVTGGAGFIGGAITARLCREGAAVVVADIDEAKTAHLLARLRSNGATVEGISCDVRERSQVAAVFEAADRRFGNADMLVNVAGIAPITPFLEISRQEWDQVFGIDLDGTFHFCQEFARRAVAAGRSGRIVNITSGAARRVRPELVHYSAAKAGVDSFTKAIAIELAPYGILVNGVNPGLIENDYNARVQRERPAEHRTKMLGIPLGRMGRPEEVAGLGSFLLGPRCTYTTGQIIEHSGGSGLGIARYT
jgi:NAD(P)-dependent dehydrogenase (short-subunit alcohol dehydrogenase family)